MKLFLFPILALLSQQAVGLVIYDFAGRCDSAAPSDIPGSDIGPGGVDCSGTATGVLSLADTYTPGTGLTTPDFISFFYSSTAGSFLATTLTNALHGILPAITGPSIEWVEIDFPSSQTGLNAIPNGGWRMEFISAGIRDNSGSAHTMDAAQL